MSRGAASLVSRPGRTSRSARLGAPVGRADLIRLQSQYLKPLRPSRHSVAGTVEYILDMWVQRASELAANQAIRACIAKHRATMVTWASRVPNPAGHLIPNAPYGLLMALECQSVSSGPKQITVTRVNEVKALGIGVDPLDAMATGFEDPHRKLMCRPGPRKMPGKNRIASTSRRVSSEECMVWHHRSEVEIILRPSLTELIQLAESVSQWH